MSKDFSVIVHNPERIEEWMAVFDTNILYVKSPIPFLANLPGHPNTLVYMLDLDQYTDEQRHRLVQHIATKFHKEPLVVESELDAQGLPILAEDCNVSVSNPLRWF